jgi:hypothetical protein
MSNAERLWFIAPNAGAHYPNTSAHGALLAKLEALVAKL